MRTSEQDAGDAGAGQPLPPSGYGFTECKFPGGPKSTILTSGCNKPCTELHENVHFNDIASCCQQANMEYFFAQKDAQKEQRIRSAWSRWAESIRATTECRAYAVSIPCLDRLISDNKCHEAKTPEARECCGELQLARADDDAGSKKYCPSALSSLPRCPFGPSGPLETTDELGLSGSNKESTLNVDEELSGRD